jgi:hypothetical protein
MNFVSGGQGFPADGKDFDLVRRDLEAGGKDFELGWNDFEPGWNDLTLGWKDLTLGWKDIELRGAGSAPKTSVSVWLRPPVCCDTGRSPARRLRMPPAPAQLRRKANDPHEPARAATPEARQPAPHHV